MKEFIWKKTSEQLPKRMEGVSYSNVPCIAYHKNRGIIVLCWNHEHEVWDDSSGDDYYCDKEDVLFWIDFRDLPTTPSTTGKE